MKILEDKVKVNKFNSKIFNEYFKGFSFCVFDIETLGLEATKEIILASIGVYKDDCFKITQYFLDSLAEEPLLVAKVIEEINKYDFVVTYNGKMFDIPFTNKRAKRLGLRQLGLNDEIKTFNFDLYMILRYYSELPNILPNLSQKEIERYMGLSNERLDEISGKESIELFQKYLFETDDSVRKELANKILLHNHDDVLMLYKILDVIKFVDFNRAISRQGFIINGTNGWRNIYVNKSDIKGNTLTITGIHNEEDFSYMQFSPYTSEFKKDNTFSISIPLERIQNGLVINLKEYELDIDELKNLGFYVNGYLILQDHLTNYMELNFLTREILNQIMKKVSR